MKYEIINPYGNLRRKCHEAADRIEQLEAALQQHQKILKVARCPDPNCDDGAIPFRISEDEWELHQCQWCEERKLALAGESDE